MLQRGEQTFKDKVSRLFRERELYVRSEGHIRYVTLKPYMLMLMASTLATLVITGVVGSFGYYMARNSAIAFRENLNNTTDSYKFTSAKSLNANKDQLKKVTVSSSVDLNALQKQHTFELKKLRNAYEHQLAEFQSSINQINGRMVNNQDAYLKELERLRSIYSSLQQRHIKLEDLMDQGWTPRMVTVPVQSHNESSDAVSSDNLPAPKTTGTTKTKQNSSLAPSALTPGDRGPQHRFSSTRHKYTPPAPKPVDVASLSSSMKDHWKKQNRTSTQINFSARKRVKEMMQVLSRLKFNLAELKLTPSSGAPDNTAGNTGGPFVELAFSDVVAIPDSFSELEFATLKPFQKIFLLEKSLLELPIRRPLSDLRSITSPFGPRMDPFRKIYAMHRGIDFRAPAGEPVLATAAGVVILTQKQSKSGYGKLLVIRHEHGVSTLYGHLSEFMVATGDRVKPGDVVGKVGNTGRSTGPHLHYEIRVGDSHVDPIDYLEAATHVF